eukprot:CAMPEP_0194425522 /NCGR_PEP_ID=MMETSP0176-20130528/24806_1 /TAXON_ID=216777 /ORGANISM="Proboscia alata, Strain PI-D3" /LENGTH=202 /DNA_ID=CAMNT_0039235883 /DNA_START=66 /DNA_END=670 /DNA_ORIENTATION=+
MATAEDTPILLSAAEANLTLSEEETKIFDLLLSVAGHYNAKLIDTSALDSSPAAAQQPPALPITIRVAGGWVRDKVLGLSSHDIDIALDTISGSQFADLIVSHLQLQQAQLSPTSLSLSKPPPKIGIINANPDQSKHLETATMKLFSHSIDFTNLRGEEYASHSRIPVNTWRGTPYQDALRRDLTVNALFYNLHTHTIEDYT